MAVKVIHEVDISGLEQEALENGELKIMDSSFYDRFNKDQIIYFCVKHGFYLLPTIELIERLETIIRFFEIPKKNIIEIGSGNGALCKALGIKGTDSYLQTRSDIRMYYEALRQPVINYGKHVIKMDAIKAIKKFKPKMVIGAWITQIWKDQDCIRGKSKASIYGVDENYIIKHVPIYLHIGAESVHGEKRILPKRNGRLINPGFIFSRSFNDDDCIYIWDKKR